MSPAAARLFRLLALHPGPDVSAAGAAALAALPPRRARSLLGELAAVHLVTEPAPGRYGFHDLLRAHAGDLLAEHHTEAERQVARDRLFRHSVERAHAAGALLDPSGDVPALPPEPPDTRAVPFADDSAAPAGIRTPCSATATR
ncbi:hypothetical protein AB0L14_17815 [Streptomyces sp. NPDC052727]|uniref:hypothetical protein n=1 Tax=Streptomyces sp. NPDC052727 TaxID=3154854 RepID=UPI00343AE499